MQAALVPARSSATPEWQDLHLTSLPCHESEPVPLQGVNPAMQLFDASPLCSARGGLQSWLAGLSEPVSQLGLKLAAFALELHAGIVQDIAVQLLTPDTESRPA